MNGTRSTRKRKVEQTAPVPEQAPVCNVKRGSSDEGEHSESTESEEEGDDWFETEWKPQSGSVSTRPQEKLTTVTAAPTATHREETPASVTPPDKLPLSDEEDTSAEQEQPFISEYERIRLQNIAERNELLRSMGINVNYQSSGSPSSAKKNKQIKRVKKEKENTPMRMSLRSKNKSAVNGSDAFADESFKFVEPEPDVDTRNLGCEGWHEDEMEGKEKLMESLREKLSDIDYDTASLNLSTCHRDVFRDVMLSLVIKEAVRVVSNRVQSLCVHPSKAKRIVFVGSTSGSLGIWDVDCDDEDSYVELHPNRRSINCITVDQYNPNMIYLTSHEGSFTLTDINTRQFLNMYATSYEDRISHLTWHDQLDPNIFLISHGDGSVLVFDKRDKVVSKRISCFQRSARTVQHHPTSTSTAYNYFLVSSGAEGGGCSIYDLRSKKQVCNMKHPRGLTSAFFSPSGNQVLTTCNDDSVKIWDSQDFSKVKLKKSIPHNNHTGRWLSVFKAQWYPGRDDIFHIGSLLNYRRIQMYTVDGTVLTELQSDDMTTIQPVLAVHRELPLVVGGNSSGRLHTFQPPH